MTKNKILAKNTIILTIGQFIPKLIAIITLPILTKSFSTEDYGIYDLIISFASLLLPIMTLLVQQAVFRFMISEEPEKQKKYISTSVFFVFAFSLCIFAIVVIIGVKANQRLDLLILAMALYFFESIYDVMGQIARGYGKNLIYSIAVIIYSTVNMIILLIAVNMNFVNIKSVLIILSISYFIATIFIFLNLKLNKVIKIKEFSIDILKNMLKYSAPMIPSSIALWIVNLSDRLIITYSLGTSYNGIYAAAAKIPNLLVTFYNAFNLAWTELAARTINENDSDVYYSKLINSLFSFCFGAIMILIAFSPILFKILIDDKFSSGYSQMPILFVGVILSCLVSFYGGLYIALKKTKQVGISSTLGAFLNAGINIALIKKIGLYAASISTVVSFFAILVYRIFEIKKSINIKYNKVNILIGCLFLIVIIFNYYKANLILLVLNIVIAIIYNVIFNSILKLLYNKFRNVWRNKNNV